MTISELREERGWTRAQLAQQVGVSVETVEYWERGLQQPFDDELRRLATVFAVPVDVIALQDPVEQE
jgi:transcriptional regulator with XRE-family HTH domain